AGLGALIGSSGNYVLANSISLTGSFTPLAGFGGNFEGFGNSISGATINGASNVGLFSTLASTGVVNDLNLTGVSVSGQSNVGALVGSNSGMLSNDTASGTVTAGSGGSAVGGLVGYNSSTGVVFASSFTGSVTVGSGSTAVGGLVGDNFGQI